ncbi:MAG: hypothetical protein HY960_11200 [Ignavibacteriae bacterium]|nr:hypothetical protein [Ignavibacteriota bacterium]
MSNIIEGLEDGYRAVNGFCTTHATMPEKRGTNAARRANYAQANHTKENLTKLTVEKISSHNRIAWMSNATTPSDSKQYRTHYD